MELTLSDELTFGNSNVAANLPDSDLTVTCISRGGGQTNWTVLRYSLQTADWSQVFQRSYTGNDSGTVFSLDGGQDKD